jgi:hypothetical protein
MDFLGQETSRRLGFGWNRHKRYPRMGRFPFMELQYNSSLHPTCLFYWLWEFNSGKLPEIPFFRRVAPVEAPCVRKSMPRSQVRYPREIWHLIEKK